MDLILSQRTILVKNWLNANNEESMYDFRAKLLAFKHVDNTLANKEKFWIYS